MQDRKQHPLPVDTWSCRSLMSVWESVRVCQRAGHVCVTCMRSFRRRNHSGTKRAGPRNLRDSEEFPLVAVRSRLTDALASQSTEAVRYSAPSGTTLMGMIFEERV